MTTAPDSRSDTEQRILAAAKRVFVRKGVDGAVMQDIADEAKISRTALHYYFRSKEKLFGAVFQDLLARFFPKANEILNQPISFREKLPRFVNEYLDLLKENPYLSNFIMNELNRDPDKVAGYFAKGELLSTKVIRRIEQELRDLNPHVSAPHFVMDLVSMCVFPFIAEPVVKQLFINPEPEAFNRFIEERKRIIVDMLMCYIDAMPLMGESDKQNSF